MAWVGETILDTQRWLDPSPKRLDGESDDLEDISLQTESYTVCVFNIRVTTAQRSLPWTTMYSRTPRLSDWYEGATLPMTSESHDLRHTFRALAEKWRKDTRFISPLRRKVLHPAYQQIIGMGKGALPLILKELEERPADWFWALHAISHDDPVPESADFDKAVNAWLAWGRAHNYV